jgi:hypothetical protein
MIKKTIFALVALGMMSFASTSNAQYCGGTIVYDNDCGSNHRGFSVSCCPSGYRVQGVAYSDLPNASDYSDALSSICRSIAKGNDMMPSDFQRAPVTHVCDKTEVFAGLECKDMDKRGGVNSDNLDGCTAVCQHPKSKNLRTIYSADLASNKRSPVRHTVLLPKRVVGIAYKDIGQKKSSDRADCATIIVKN